MTFGGYRIDSVHRTVTTPRGDIVRLEPKAFDVLLYLIGHSRETVSREQLIADLWGGRFVTEDAVMVAVYAVRQAFGDSAKSPRFIETIRGRGYRWIGQQEEDVRPVRRKWLAAAVLALTMTGLGAMVGDVLRSPRPMPSMRRTEELVRANARGVFFSERTTRADLEQARTEFRNAIRIDERFAEPHAALAQVCVRLVEVGATENEQEARREAKRAMDLAPRLALSHAASGTVQYVLDRDAKAAERSYLEAIGIDPALPGVRRRYSYLLGALGRFDEATAQAQTAVKMDPTSAGALNDLAWSFVIAGRLDEADRLYAESERLDPANGGILLSHGYCQELRNATADAMHSYRRAMELFNIPRDVIERCDRAFTSSGIAGVNEIWLQRMSASNTTPRFLLAFYAIRAGHRTEAMQLLQQATERREPATLWLAVHPAFASLRDQRGFSALVASSFHTR